MSFLILPPVAVELAQSDLLQPEPVQVSSTLEVIVPPETQDVGSEPLAQPPLEELISEPNLEGLPESTQEVTIDENPLSEEVQISEQESIPDQEEPPVVEDEILPEPLDFTQSQIIKMKAIDPAYVAVLVNNEMGNQEIWFYDFYNYVQRDVGDRIGTSEQVLQNSPLGAKGRFFFWLGNNTIFAFDAVAQKLQSKEFYVESGRVCFEECSFDVILRNNEFYFYSQKTGEVFSDDNSALRMQLYNLHLKNLPKSREDLVEQNFTVPDEAL